MQTNTTTKKKVIILGGGVAGLSAAHHLLTKGNDQFEVEIYERRFWGGKARSAFKDNLPTEHGFRFFPGFYKHITETLKEIPLENGNKVYNNLVDTKVYTFLFSNKSGRLDVPINIGTWVSMFRFSKIRQLINDLRNQIKQANIDITPKGKERFIDGIMEVYTSCNMRIESTYDNVSWSEFIDAKDEFHQYGADYEILLATGISKNLVAVRADVANSRTGAKLIGHMLWHIVSPTAPRADKILNAPTNISWIDPWVNYLRSKGLKTFINRRVVSVEFDPEHKTITGMRHDCVNNADHKPWDYYSNPEVVAKLDLEKAAYFICAMPIERVDEMLERSLFKDGKKITCFDHNLSNFEEIWKNTEWMTGCMFYFDTEIPIAEGHITIADEKAAVTIISQMQFWKEYLNDNRKKIYNKDKRQVKAVLSVIVSNWDAEPKYISNTYKKKRLKDLEREEVIEEIKQIIFRCEIEKGKKLAVYEANLMGFFLDDSIVKYDNNLANPRYQEIQGQVINNNSIPGGPVFKPFNLYNKEPLFINKIHTYHLRPTGYTSFTNFFLAGDYIKTNADLGCMDSADEAARRAVNNIFTCEKMHARCKIDNYTLPSFFGLFDTARILDYIDFKKGLAYRKNIIRKLITWYLRRTLEIIKPGKSFIIKALLLLGLGILFLLTYLLNLVYKFILKQIYVTEV